jgi:hypothetical protein
MEDLRTVCKIIQPGDLLMKIDLKKAYHQLPIYPPHRRFLGLKVNNQCYKFNVLPFGISQAPLALTKSLKPSITQIRDSGIRVVVYLDDILIASKDPSDGMKVVEILNRNGWKINQEKSVLQPMMQLEFLGATLNTSSMTITPTPEFCQGLATKLEKSSSLRKISLHQIRQIKGSLAWASRFSRTLRSLSHQISLRTQEVSPHLKHTFLQLAQLTRSLPPIPILTAPDLIVTTDSSDFALGATLSSSTGHVLDTISKKMTYHQRRMHIVSKEALAMMTAIDHWQPHFRGKVVSFYIDNHPLCHAMRKGFSPSKRLQTYVQTMTKKLSAAAFTWFFPIKSQQNQLADHLSRQTQDWMLNPEVFRQVVQWSQLQPDVELFASETNHLMEKFITKYPCQRALDYDAFKINWTGWNLCYANPPFDLIHLALNKAQRDKANLLLIYPVWRNKPWWPLTHLAKKTMNLPTRKDLFVNLNPSIPLNPPNWQARASLFLFKESLMDPQYAHQAQTPSLLNPLTHILPQIPHQDKVIWPSPPIPSAGEVY